MALATTFLRCPVCAASRPLGREEALGKQRVISTKALGGAAATLTEQPVHPGKVLVLAGKGGLEVLVAGQLPQVPQGSHCRPLPQHLRRHPPDVTGAHFVCAGGKQRPPASVCEAPCDTHSHTRLLHHNMGQATSGSAESGPRDPGGAEGERAQGEGLRLGRAVKFHKGLWAAEQGRWAHFGSRL